MNDEERWWNAQQKTRAVYELWRLRNGSLAVIEQRLGGLAGGHIDGTLSVHTWAYGKTPAGPGYDLVELIDARACGGRP